MPHSLTSDETYRLETIRSCSRGESTNTEAAARLGLTVRQVQRLKRRVEAKGDQGIVHGGRGKTSNRKTASVVIDIVVAFLKQPSHTDFGPTFAQEKLAAEGTVLGVETLRTLMTKEGLWKERKRRGPLIHRAWRERMPLAGQLVQFDGSYHRWLEEREEEGCLLAAIDDATSEVTALFEDNEGVRSVFRFWWAYFVLHGLPVAVYLDKFGTYKVNHKNAVDNADMMTQFERAMGELGVKVICANSPQAKGRVERLFGTLQDRLVKELRLRSIKNREEANWYLTDEYLAEHNERFSVAAQTPGDAHRPLSQELCERLPSIFSIQSVRKVHNDFTVQFKNQWLQLSAVQDIGVYKKDEVVIEERLDDTLHIRLKETYLMYTVLPARPKSMRIPVTALTRTAPQWKPPIGHPWRKG